MWFLIYFSPQEIQGSWDKVLWVIFDIGQALPMDKGMVGLLALVFPKRGNLSQSSCMLEKNNTWRRRRKTKHLPTYTSKICVHKP